MLHFDSDYMEGMHPRILQRLSEINMEQQAGYGTDSICKSAREKIQKACSCPDAEIHFLTGGTQTNAIVIKSLLRPYEGVIAADTGHINVHEAGAIEAGGHKVLSLPDHSGKLHSEEVENYLAAFYNDENHTHMVKPGMVYISHPTEYGTLYTKEELETLHNICQKYHIPLYLDGARLAYGLAASQTDVTLDIIAHTCDVFYIGGTKTGAMFGEAVVFPRHLVDDFFTIIKQNGALLAKGWYLGVQFDELFSHDLYIRCGRNAIETSDALKEGLKEKGYGFFVDSPTNQQFVILENNKMAQLTRKVSFSYWGPYDEDHTIVRFATSWATQMEQVKQLIELM